MSDKEGSSKRLLSDDESGNKNIKKTKKLSDLPDDVVELAWAHYRAFLDSENEVDMEEVADIDELHEVISLLSDHVSFQEKEFSIDKLQIFCPKSNSFGSVRSLLPVLLSMVHLHIANYLISQGFMNNDTEDESNDSNPSLHLEKSLMYFPFNASSLSVLANYKRMNLKDSNEIICSIYEHANFNARVIRDFAISILDEDNENSSGEDIYKEWVELIFLDGMTGVEYIGDDEGSEDDEGGENSVEKDEINRMEMEGAQECEYSTSDVESVSSFMAAMLHSTLGNHDKALEFLKKFNISHRIHPNVWEFSKGKESCDLQTVKGNDVSKMDFEPRAFKGNVLPYHLYNRLCDIFCPKAAFWKESNYQNRGYYSFFNDLNDDVKSNPANIIEDIVVNYLLPLVEKEIPTSTKKIVGFEWWTHTRPLSANLGHQLHFDTDEALLDKEKELTHPIVSSVLYLTGNKTRKCQTAGSTIVFDQSPESNEVASKAYVSHAFDNSFMIFPGNCLHGVLPCPGSDETNPDNTVERLTLMVGFWTRRVPDNIDDKKLYSPCSPLPPVSNEHSWVKDIKDKYPKAAISNDMESCSHPCTTESISLPFVTPAWERIEIDEKICKQSSIPIPNSLDHRYFVHGAPHCFRDSLYKDESFS